MLHACCKSGYAGCVATLLREGSPHVEIDARTEGGFTPLAYAARGGFLDIVSALVAAGAETEILQQADARRFLPTDAVRRTLVREAVSVGAAAYRSTLRETMMHGCEAPFSSMPEVLISLVIEYVLPPIGGGGGKRSSSADQREEDDGADDEVAVATAAVEGILGLDE
jgi:ankyrin repeat protein